ncbi:Protein Y57G11C.20 [Aphelenchoides avenae]|nr:Protein Y57G11C.20 [Aphelenchus avenae]
MQRQSQAGGVRSKRATPQNSTQLLAATRQLWAEWADMGRNPEHLVSPDPTKRIIKRKNAKGEEEMVSVPRPSLPPSFAYQLREQIMPDGRKRNFVDIVNTEEQARWLGMLRDAQDVIKHEEEHDSDIFSLDSYNRFINETMVPATSIAGVPTNKMRKQKNYRVELRPPLPPGWKYAFGVSDDPDDPKRIVKIVPDVAAEDAAGAETQRAALRILDTIQVDTAPPKRRKTERVATSSGVDSTAPSGIWGEVFEERTAVEDDTAAAAAAAVTARTLDSVATAEGAESTPATGMHTFAEAEDLPPEAPDVVERKLDKQPAETLGAEQEVAEADGLDILRATRFVYLKELNRFRLETDPARVKFVSLSPQLSYNLGYELGEKITHEELSRYAPDMRGGVNHICTYCNIAENVIVGDKMTSLLRVVAVNGKPGDVVEKTYDQPIFSRVSRKEVADIEIQLRSLSGRLTPFEFGNVVATLQFRKVLY